MPKYSEERKEAVLIKLLPPYSKSVAQVAKEEGISEQTLYNWRSKIKLQGKPVPGNKTTTEQWSAEAKLAVIIATAHFSESELSQYCRENGLYVEQVRQWKEDCLGGFKSSGIQKAESKQQVKEGKKKLRALEK